MREVSLKIRYLKDKIFKLLIVFLTILSATFILLVIFYILKNGIATISLELLTQLPKPVGIEGGGIANAIVGSFIVIILASLLCIPFGITVGIYLAENKGKKMANLVRSLVDILQSIPSIVVGLVAYIWVVKPMGKFSALSGAVALALLMLPVIVRSCEEVLKLIPDYMKEASLALGVPYYRTILKAIIPAALCGILTGILLSISRAFETSAPLLFTAFGNPFMSINIFEPIETLQLLIFRYAISPYPQWHKLAYGASFVLLIIILTLNIITQIITKRWRIQF